MMVVEKYCTLPPSTSSSSPIYYSTAYHSSTTTIRNRIRDIKQRLQTEKTKSLVCESDNMKLLIEQQPIIRTFSLHDVQHRIDYFEKKTLVDDSENSSKEKSVSNPSLSASSETLQSVIANTLQQTYFGNGSYGNTLSRTLMNSTAGDHFFSKRRSYSSGNLVASNDSKRSTRYCSLLSKRSRTYSLSNHPALTTSASITCSEEQNTEPQETTSLDYENTYFNPEETTRLDDPLSLTTITSNTHVKTVNTQHDVSVSSDTTVFQSDTDDNSEIAKPPVKQSNPKENITSIFDSVNDNTTNNNEQIIRMRLNSTPCNHEFTGVVHATKCTIVNDNECLSDHDDVNHCFKQDNKIRSNRDYISLNKSMMSSSQHEHCRRISSEDQLNQQSKRTNENEYHDDDDEYVYSEETNQQSVIHLTKMDNDIKIIAQNDENDYDDEDGHYSDESHYSDDLRYSSDAARNSCASDDPNNTSSTLRQEAISVTRVRCKRRKTWIRSPSSPTRSSTNNNTNNNNNNRNSPRTTNYLQKHRLNPNLFQPFLSINPVDGTDARQNANLNTTPVTKTATSTVFNHTRVKPTATEMLLHGNSLNCNNNNNNKGKIGEVPSYDFISLNNDYRSIKNDQSRLTKNIITPTKDATSFTSNERNNGFYTPSLSPVKRLLNESIDSNIEVIQMDEQECILEIVDGVLTIVPKDKSISSSLFSDIDKSREQHDVNFNSSNHQKQRTSSIASSISTPSFSEHDQERDDFISMSSSRVSSKPFIVSNDIPMLQTASPIQTEHTTDVLDLLSTSLISVTPMNKSQKNCLDDSLSSVSSCGDRPSEIKRPQPVIPRSSSPINNKPKASSIKDTSLAVVENQTRSNKSNVLTQLLETIKKTDPIDEADTPQPKPEYPSLKTEPLPVPKPINKARISEFASLLSSSVHLSQPQPIKKSQPSSSTAKHKIASPPIRSEDHSSSSVPSVCTDREERESYHTVKSQNSEQDQIKRHIDARYTEKLDDRGSIQVKTANIRALFEQKISDTTRALSQSSDHLLNLSEIKHHPQQQQQQQHKKVPISYGSLQRNLPIYPQPLSTNITKRRSYLDVSTMSKYTDHIAGKKDVVIEDKQNVRRNSLEPINRSMVDSSLSSPALSTNGFYSESLIAREIRETKEKEEELKRQRRKCGLDEDGSSAVFTSTNDSIKTDTTLISTQSVKNSSFLSNLDFFMSKSNGSLNESTSTISSPRRSMVSSQNLVYDSNNASPSNRSRQVSSDELRQMTNVVSQELSRFTENGISNQRTSSTNGLLQRSSSNQNILSPQSANNIIQREIEAIRAKEAELRELGRIQHTSDEHADPRKYHEVISTLSKSQSINGLSTGKVRRDSENQHTPRHQGPMIATTNGFLKPKVNNTQVQNNNTINNCFNHHSPTVSVRSKFPSPNPAAPVVSASNKLNEYSRLSLIDRLELEKRQCQEREQELKKQRNSVCASTSSTNTTVNGDSGNVSQDEHDEDQERYFDKIERLKRTENEKAHAPMIRPTKKFDMSNKWEQMMASKADD